MGVVIEGLVVGGFCGGSVGTVVGGGGRLLGIDNEVERGDSVWW